MTRPSFHDLDLFTRAYIEAALWTDEELLTDEYIKREVEPLGTGSVYKPDHEDLADETLRKIIEDCAEFQKDNAHILNDKLFKSPAILAGNFTYDQANAGHDFWLTRNGHGAGFWDRGLGDIGEALTTSAENFKAFDLYVGDDGRIYA